MNVFKSNEKESQIIDLVRASEIGENPHISPNKYLYEPTFTQAVNRMELGPSSDNMDIRL